MQTPDSLVLYDIQRRPLTVGQCPEFYGHCLNPANYTLEVLREANDEDLYRVLFRGRRDMTVVDLGAHVGLYSCFFASAAKRIIAVEPNPDFCRVLTALTSQQGLKQVEVVQAGIWAFKGFSTYHIDRTNTTANSLQQMFGGEVRQVSTLTLADLFQQKCITKADLLKMDIEGSEMLVLFSDSFPAEKIGALVVSVHAAQGASIGHNQHRVKQRLEELGFLCCTRGNDVYALKE